MPNFELATLINWITSGLIGAVFGILIAWTTYRYGRKRDDISWAREKAKLEQQFEHDRQLLEVGFKQRVAELERQLAQQENLRLREKLTEGIGNAGQETEKLLRSEVNLRRGARIRVTPDQVLAVATLFAQAINQIQNLQRDWEGMGRFISPQLIQALTNSQHSLQEVAQRFIQADQAG